MIKILVSAFSAHIGLLLSKSIAVRKFSVVALAISLLIVILFTSPRSLALESNLLDSDALQSEMLAPNTSSIEDKLKGKSASEKANIKAAEIVKHSVKGTFEHDGIKIDIQSIEKIDGGVQIFARAWKNNDLIGFGSDGSVEIERFRIFNPPVLVRDPEGSIVRTWTSALGEERQTKYREDPAEALRQVIAHTIKVSGIEGATVVEGKRGNTTDTFFPNANPESTSVDGFTRYGPGSDVTFSALVGGNGTASFDSFPNAQIFLRSTATTDRYDLVDRFHALFDTSILPDNDTVASAVFSIYGINDSANELSLSANVYDTNPASNTAITDSDHQLASSTAQATAIAQSAFSASNYTDWTLTATGRASIAKTGVTKFALRYVNDASGVAPTWAPSKNNYFGFAAAEDSVGDPKLVIVHSASASAASSLLTSDQSNPTNLTTSAPTFSAIYNDPDISDVAASYEIQVSTTSAFTNVHWDSGKTALASSTAQGTRIDAIIFAGSSLASSTTYYWRIKFWDVADVEGAWSTETASFSLAAAVIPTKVRKAINEQVTNSTTPQSDDELRLVLAANSTYIVEGVIFATSTSATPDILIRLSAPTGSLLNVGYTTATDEEMLTNEVTSARIALQANTPRSIHFTGTVKTSGTAGDLIIKWAQATANAAPTTVMQGSYLKVDTI